MVFAVLAATLSLVSIFAPVIFLGGIIGQFFKSFAVVVTFGVLVSLFVSLTLTPMLCSRYLKVEKTAWQAVLRSRSYLYCGMDRFYRAMLGHALAHRWKIVLLTVIIVVSSVGSLPTSARLLSRRRRGAFHGGVGTPLGSSIDYTDSRLSGRRWCSPSIRKLPGISPQSAWARQARSIRAFASVRMVTRDERKLKQ